MTSSSTWTTPSDLKAKVRKRWDDGTLLRAHAAQEPFPGFDLPLRGPTARELGEDLGRAQDWVATLERGSHGNASYTLAYSPIGGRHIGRNQIPTRAHLTTYAQAWRLLGVRDTVEAYDRILHLTEQIPHAHQWAALHPHKALAVADAWPEVLEAYRWLNQHRGSGFYLRQISAPGVDTKTAERHRTVLAQLLEVPSTTTGFVAGLGLRAKPDLVRLRPNPNLGLLRGVSELALRADELPLLTLDVTTALVVENEITYLSVPIPDQGIVLWGKGFEVAHIGRLPWLASAAIQYWGDLDTHGFAILDQLRAYLPQTTSLCMDRATLLQHRDRWGTEPSPTHARLRHLTPDEAKLYDDLVTDRLGQRVRLEQERIDWTWATTRLTQPPGASQDEHDPRLHNGTSSPAAG